MGFIFNEFHTREPKYINISLYLSVTQDSPGLGRGVSGLYPAPALALGAGHELVEASLAAGEHGAAGAGVATVTRALQCEDIIIS